MTRLRSLAIAFSMLVACAMAAPTARAADDYPNRPVRILVPFPAGGPTDVNMRILGQKLSEIWGEGVVIENRPGGNTGIAATAVARAEPDGYTLLAAMDSTLVMNPAMAVPMNYDPFKDFAPITLTARNTSLLTVHAESPFKTIKDLIAHAKKNGKPLTYGAGIAITQLAGQRFGQEAGIEVTLVPYRGSSEVVQGLLTQSVDFIVDGIAPSLPLISTGKFRPLAKLNSRHLTALPDVPLLAKAPGLPLEEMASWIALVAPDGTPPAVVDKIHRDVVKAYEDETVIKRLDEAGITADTMAPDELNSFYRKEAEHWTQTYKKSGLKFK